MPQPIPVLSTIFKKLASKGALLSRDDSATKAVPSSYGVGWNYLHTEGDNSLGFKDIQDLITYITGGLNRWVVAPTKIIPIPSISRTVAENHSGGGSTSTKSASVPTPAVSEPATATASPLSVGAGIAHDDDGADTDETTATNNDTAGDMHLLPSPAAVGDGFYLGLSSQFDWAAMNIGTAGAGTWTITWKYWNGTTWTALTMKYDETSNFRTTGLKRAHWVRPGDWATKNILGSTLYYVKAEVTAYTSMTTQPLGTRAWLGQY